MSSVLPDEAAPPSLSEGSSAALLLPFTCEVLLPEHPASDSAIAAASIAIPRYLYIYFISCFLLRVHSPVTGSRFSHAIFRLYKEAGEVASG